MIRGVWKSLALVLLLVCPLVAAAVLYLAPFTNRPAYNTGVGFFVGTNKILYDANGIPFRMKGVNQTHYDSGSGTTAITNTKANVVRFGTYWDNYISFGPPPTYISATQFSVTGNQTAFFYPNGRVFAFVTAGTVFGTISAAVFTSLTTVTVSWDSGSLDSGLSAVAYGTRAADFVAQLTSEEHDHSVVAIPQLGLTSIAYGHVTTTCSSSASDLVHAVDQWVDQAAIWKPIERWSIINIANEWGSSNSTTWRDSYITAISRMRAAGYLNTLLIDSGNCGQDTANLINYGTAVFNSDAQKNIVFAIHLYGNLTNGLTANNNVTNITRANPAVVTYTGNNAFVNGYQVIITGTQGMTQVNSVDQNNIIFTVANVNMVAKTFELSGIDSTGYTAYSAPLAGTPNAVGLYSGQSYATTLLQSLVNTGLPIIVGEFGPGRNIGPSPTMTWPGDVIKAANALGVGWIGWAIDDNDLGGSSSDDAWFSMVYHNGVYNNSADLTIYGKDVIESAAYGIKANAVPATIFP